MRIPPWMWLLLTAFGIAIAMYVPYADTAIFKISSIADDTTRTAIVALLQLVFIGVGWYGLQNFLEGVLR